MASLQLVAAVLRLIVERMGKFLSHEFTTSVLRNPSCKVLQQFSGKTYCLSLRLRVDSLFSSQTFSQIEENRAGFIPSIHFFQTLSAYMSILPIISKLLHSVVLKYLSDNNLIS